MGIVEHSWTEAHNRMECFDLVPVVKYEKYVRVMLSFCRHAYVRYFVCCAIINVRYRVSSVCLSYMIESFVID